MLYVSLSGVGQEAQYTSIETVYLICPMELWIWSGVGQESQFNHQTIYLICPNKLCISLSSVGQESQCNIETIDSMYLQEQVPTS